MPIEDLTHILVQRLCGTHGCIQLANMDALLVTLLVCVKLRYYKNLSHTYYGIKKWLNTTMY